MPSSSELFVNVALKAWKQNIDRGTKLFSGLSEEQLLKEVASGKNRLIYLWGHLAAVNDAMIPLLGIGERVHPELDEFFIVAPDKSLPQLPTGSAIKRSWDEINDKLQAGFDGLTPEDWLKRHNSVSEEDFAREPHRNRFAILLGRTSHLAYHFAQAVLATK
jgi:DinB superfamily